MPHCETCGDTGTIMAEFDTSDDPSTGRAEIVLIPEDCPDCDPYEENPTHD